MVEGSFENRLGFVYKALFGTLEHTLLLKFSYNAVCHVCLFDFMMSLLVFCSSICLLVFLLPFLVNCHNILVVHSYVSNVHLLLN